MLPVESLQIYPASRAQPPKRMFSCISFFMMQTILVRREQTSTTSIKPGWLDTMIIDSSLESASSADMSHLKSPVLWIKTRYGQKIQVTRSRPKRAPKRRGKKGYIAAASRENKTPPMPKTASEIYNAI